MSRLPLLLSLLVAATPAAALARAAASDTASRVVVIDAGHGGRDSGRIGPDGVREKDVTLKLAKRLGALLRRQGYEVHLTRTTDTLIALADRPRMANHWKAGRPASLFISIHCNAGVPGSRGFETYFLSDARTEDERRVAEMENAAAQYEEKHDESGSDVDRILNTLRNDYYIRASDDLAEIVQRRLARIEPGPDRGVKRAGFRVLVGAFMPAVLVETAFISDRREERLLASASFQRELVSALGDAVDAFFASHPRLVDAAGAK